MFSRTFIAMSKVASISPSSPSSSRLQLPAAVAAVGRGRGRGSVDDSGGDGDGGSLRVTGRAAREVEEGAAAAAAAAANSSFVGMVADEGESDCGGAASGRGLTLLKSSALAIQNDKW